MNVFFKKSVESYSKIVGVFFFLVVVVIERKENSSIYKAQQIKNVYHWNMYLFPIILLAVGLTSLLLARENKFKS